MELFDDSFRCDKCPRKYKSNHALWKHFRLKHDSSFTIPRYYSKKCFYCGFETRVKSVLASHMIKTHHDRLMLKPKVARITCAAGLECDEKFENYGSYFAHLESDHTVKVETDDLIFCTEEQFQDWKRLIITGHYIKERGPYSCKDKNIDYLRCHRSYVPQITSGRRTKFKGSVKIGRACPSTIRVERTPSQIKVHFVKTHVGHLFELGKMPLTEEERGEIVKKLTAGNTFDQVLADIKASTDSSRENGRIHLVSRKDLHNIVKQYKLNVGKQEKRNGVEKAEDGSRTDVYNAICEHVQALQHLVRQSELRCCVYSDDWIDSLIVRHDDDTAICDEQDYTREIQDKLRDVATKMDGPFLGERGSAISQCFDRLLSALE